MIASAWAVIEHISKNSVVDRNNGIEFICTNPLVSVAEGLDYL